MSRTLGRCARSPAAPGVPAEARIAGVTPSASRQAFDGWAKADWKVAAALFAVPAVLLSAAAIAGYPLITGDDVAQNFPLEELSGRIVRSGHFPLWDGFIWSGTPLLGGANAHGLLPITLLFAVLPPLAAWVVGEVVVVALAAVGCQLFLRRTGCATVPAAIGGAWFGLGGFVSSQLVHIDFAAAAAALPWALVALDGIAEREGASRPRHSLLLAASLAWICLAASPDIVIDAALVLVAYTVHLLLGSRRHDRPALSAVTFAGWAGAGVLAGLALGGVQILPVADFLTVSQRASPGYGFISAGSLKPTELLEELVPHLLGGGLLGLRKYVTASRLPLAEVDAYPGVIALGAIGVMTFRALRRSPEAARSRVFLVILLIALVLACGAHTPLEHLVFHLPITGDQRLPARALVCLALSGAVLSGYFLDDLWRREPGQPLLSKGELLAGIVPLVAIVGVVLATAVAGRPAGGAIGTGTARGWSLTGVAPYLAVSGLVALAGCALLLVAGRTWSRDSARRGLRAAAVALALCDLLLFDVNQSSLAPEYAFVLSGHTEAEQELSVMARGGRVLEIDPSITDETGLDKLGVPDLNVIDSLPEAGGYSSLAWGPYASSTGTHTQYAASAAALENGTFDSLGVRVVMALASAMSSSPKATSRGARRAGWEVGRRGGSVRYLGRSVTVRAVTLRLAHSASPAEVALLRRAGTDLRLVGEDGRVLAARGAVTASGSEETVTFPGVRAVGIAVEERLAGTVELAAPILREEGGESLRAAGSLSEALSGPHYVEGPTIAGFASFIDTRAARIVHVTGSQASVQVVSSSALTGSMTVRVRSGRPVELVRAVADVPGWEALVRAGGHTRQLAVKRDGLVQSVMLPAGTTTVTFTYDPPGWSAGLALSLGGLVACGLLAALSLGWRLGTRRRGP